MKASLDGCVDFILNHLEEHMSMMEVKEEPCEDLRISYKQGGNDNANVSVTTAKSAL